MANRHMEPIVLFIMLSPIARIAGCHFLLVVACLLQRPLALLVHFERTF